MIRPAIEEDAGFISRLCAQLGYATSEKVVEARLRKFADDKFGVVYVADANGVVLGWIQVSLRSTVESGECAEIVGLVVDENSRGQGIGKTLVTQGEDWARKMHQHSLRVRTNVVRVESHRFYESLDFEETKKQTVYRKEL